MKWKENLFGDRQISFSEILLVFFPLHFVLPWQIVLSSWWPWNTVGPMEILFYFSAVLAGSITIEAILGKQILNNKFWWLTFITFLMVTIYNLGAISLVDDHTLKYIGSRKYSGIPFYLATFLFSYVILIKNWKIGQIEKFFFIIISIGLLFFVDSVFTLIFLPCISDAYNGSGMFHSNLTFSTHHVSKFSLIVMWLSVYLFFATKKKLFIVLAIFTILPILMTSSRATVIAMFVGCIVFSTFVLFAKTKQSLPPQLLKGISILLIIGTPLLFIIGLNYARTNLEGKERLCDYKVVFMRVIAKNDQLLKPAKNDQLLKPAKNDQLLKPAKNDQLLKQKIDKFINGFISAIIPRTYQHIRALDVLIEKPFGTGGGVGYLMCFSEEIPPWFSSKIFKNDSFMGRSYNGSTGWMGTSIFQKNPGLKDSTFSLHNATFMMILDYGIFAILFFLYFSIRICQNIFSVMKFRTKISLNDYLAFAILVSALISIAVATSSTSRFPPHWIYMILYFSIKLKTESIIGIKNV